MNIRDLEYPGSARRTPPLRRAADSCHVKANRRSADTDPQLEDELGVMLLGAHQP